MPISEGEYSKFGELVEAQDPRTLRRYLDYGKRAKSGQGLSELSQWIGKILLDALHAGALNEREVRPVDERIRIDEEDARLDLRWDLQRPREAGVE